MDAQRPFLSFPVIDQRAVYELTKLCAELQRDVHTLQCQIMQLEQQVTRNRDDVGNIYEGMDSLIAMRNTLNSVFVLPTPCAYCNGTGELGDGENACTECQGTGVQS